MKVVVEFLKRRILKRNRVVPRVVLRERKHALKVQIVVFDVYNLVSNTRLLLLSQLSQKLLFRTNLLLSSELGAVFRGLETKVRVVVHDV